MSSKHVVLLATRHHYIYAHMCAHTLQNKYDWQTQLKYSYKTIQFKTLTFSNEECCERATENIHKKLETGKKMQLVQMQHIT